MQNPPLSSCKTSAPTLNWHRLQQRWDIVNKKHPCWLHIKLTLFGKATYNTAFSAQAGSWKLQYSNFLSELLMPALTCIHGWAEMRLQVSWVQWNQCHQQKLHASVKQDLSANRCCATADRSYATGRLPRSYSEDHHWLLAAQQRLALTWFTRLHQQTLKLLSWSQRQTDCASTTEQAKLFWY